jgi:hypothetical protein
VTDAVYVLRDGDNPELRYSLRTLANVEHDRVWIFGGAPSWINYTTVTHHKRIQGGTPYSSTRGHIQAACYTAEVSDPFVLWNDDFYAMRPIGSVPLYHRGPLEAMLEEYAALRTPWAKGLRGTVGLMEKRGLLAGAMSYDVHLPLVVHKEAMREALRLAKNITADAVHLRTLYGAVAGCDGVEHDDPKLMRRSDPFPRGAWLSSGDNTFRSTVEPVLRYLFPDKSPYEKE